MKEPIRVSDIIANFLTDHEIRHVFGIVGSGNAQIFDSISRKGYTEIVCVHHEQAALMAMQTYFRTSGKVSACILTTELVLQWSHWSCERMDGFHARPDHFRKREFPSLQLKPTHFVSGVSRAMTVRRWSAR